MNSRYKYDFGPFVKDQKMVLPDDVNELVRNAVAKLKSKDLTAGIDYMEKKRRCGEIHVYDSRPCMVAKFDFQFGVCKTYYVIWDQSMPLIKPPIHVMCMPSQRNDMVCFRKPKKETYNGKEENVRECANNAE